MERSETGAGAVALRVAGTITSLLNILATFRRRNARFATRTEMAPEEGLEPSTTRLTAACSTIELLWNSEERARYKSTLEASTDFQNFSMPATLCAFRVEILIGEAARCLTRHVFLAGAM